MKILVEKEAENFLEKEGFNVVERETAKNKEELKKIFGKFEFPVAMKVSSKNIIHKAKIGGVIINIRNENDAEKAFDKLKQIEGFEEVLVQKMVDGGEMIIGLKKTPEFGLTIMVGAGGTKVERRHDVSFRICPITEKDADEMLKETKFYNELKEKKANMGLIIKNIMKVSELSKKYPSINELDINPLFVSEKEAIIADARIVF